MIQYILECMAFQLVFLIIFDLLLKRETFFQWNRAYLISTYILSLIMPWIKIEALKTLVPATFQDYPEFLWNSNNASVTIVEAQESSFNLPWEYVLLFSGMFLAMLFFGYKLYQIQQLKRKGEVHYFPDFTQIIISNSTVAFSFFKSIFLGDKVIEKEHKSVVQHELVHIRQRHSYDLIFFELMRIVGWFNPLVYIYQSRVSELHEFIADAQVAKTHKKEQYQLLLSQVFQTQHISFINQFFKSSLIKKRIVMLQKAKSKRIFQLKYLALVPIIMVMLFYTSCEQELGESDTIRESISVADIENLTIEEVKLVFTKLMNYSGGEENWSLRIQDKRSSIEFSKPNKADSGISGPGGIILKAKMHIESSTLDDDFSLFDTSSKGIKAYLNEPDFPFATIEEVPIFPGCENEADTRACFNAKIQEHIRKNFNYPEEAQEKGIQGRVSILFTITRDGSIQNAKFRGPDQLLEKEAERIISRLPKMQPGKHKGKTVNVPFSIPINFKLQ